MTVESGIQEAVEMTLDGVADKFEREIVRRYIKDLEAALNDQKAANALLMQSSNAISLTAKQQRQRAEAAELSLKLIEADNRDLEDAHRRIGELEKAREDEVTDSELAILENVKLRERIKELQEQLGQTSDTNPVQELTQEVDRKTFGHLQDRVKELEAQLSDAIERAEAAEWQDTGFCPRCHADELRQSTDLYDDELNLSVIVYRCGACGAAWAGDPVHWVDLAKQLTAMRQRAEAAEAKLLELRLALGAAVERANRLAIWADRYGADQWRRGNAGQEPQEFDEWQKEAQP